MDAAAQHNESLRKQRVIESKKARRLEKNKITKAKSYFEENPGAGPLIDLTTIYMDSYRRARSCYSAKLPRRYSSMTYMQQY